jgi:serine/threonine-protein kinase
MKFASGSHPPSGTRTCRCGVSCSDEPKYCANSDVWKLADFGIARLPDSTLTVAGEFLGSPSYAAAESLRAGQFSPESDVYGLGATLYERH